MHYDTVGPRWLAVSGAYRKFVIYDIKIFMQPIIMKEEVHKNILLSMDWCPLWETLLYSYCDSIPNSEYSFISELKTFYRFEIQLNLWHTTFNRHVAGLVYNLYICDFTSFFVFLYYTSCFQ